MIRIRHMLLQTATLGEAYFTDITFEWITVFDLISEHALISGHPPFS